MYLKSRNPLLTFLLSYRVSLTSKFQVNFRFELGWYCLINFWNFHNIHVFEVRESNGWYFYRATLFELPRKSRSTSGSRYLEGTDDCILWIFTISSLFMFSRSRNSLLTFLLSYDVWLISKIQVNFRFERYWWFCLINFWNVHTFHVFEVREFIADISI